jgi:urease accessory protein UreF
VRAWLAATLDETIGRMEGPAVWQAWRAFQVGDFDALMRLD